MGDLCLIQEVVHFIVIVEKAIISHLMIDIGSHTGTESKFESTRIGEMRHKSSPGEKLAEIFGNGH